MLIKTKKLLKQFKSAIQGSVATITALTIPVLLLGAGFSLDYGLAMNAQKELKAAVDTAALGALNEARIAYLNDEDVDIEKLVQEATNKIFATRADKFKFLDISNLKIEPSIKDNVFSNEVTFDAKYNTLLMKHAGVDTVDLKGTSRATVSTTSYINIHFVIDVSASMGIGATPNDQQILANTIGCAFACHIGEEGDSTYDKARAAGADMRIDVARESAISSVDLIRNNIGVDNQVTFGLSVFSNTSREIIAHDDKKAGDYNYVKNKIKEEVFMTSEDGGTNIEGAVKEIAESLPANGNGLNEDSRLQYIVVLTDGVESTQARVNRRWVQHDANIINAPYQRHDTHEVNYAPSSDYCSIMREKDINTFFIYTEYVEPSFGDFNNHDKQRFSFIENELFDLIPERFEECSGSASRVLRADTPSQIEDAFMVLVGNITEPLRLY